MIAIGDIMLARGEGTEAAEMFVRALDCDPLNVPAKIRLAQAHLQNGSKNAAIAEIKAAVNLDADVSGRAYEAMIGMLLAVGHHAEAGKLKAQQIGEEATKAKKRVFAFAANA